MNIESALKQVQCIFINDCTAVQCTGVEEKPVVVQGTVVELSRPDPQLHPTRPLSLALDDGTGVLKVAIFRNSAIPYLDKVVYPQSNVLTTFHATRCEYASLGATSNTTLRIFP